MKLSSVLLSLLLSALAGCSFSSKPALPKQASLESAGRPAATDFAPMIAEADLIYFPSESAASGARSEPSALLLETLQQTGKPFAIGWDLIDSSQQPLLDELETKPIAERAEVIARLELVGTGRAREHCRTVLREAPLGTQQLALRCPAGLIVKLASGEAPTVAEEKELPRGYRGPEGGLANYTERQLSKRSSADVNLAQSYRVQMLTQQFAAERLVRYFRRAGREAKMVAFVGRSDLEEGHGVPSYVAQKLGVRQLVFGPEESRTDRPRMLTLR